MAWKMRGAASCGVSRLGGSAVRSTNTRSVTASSGTSMDVTYRGRASVHHSSDTSGNGSDAIMQYIGDGANYTAKYLY